MSRKSELREVVLDIVWGREKVFYEPSQFAHLKAGVAEILHRRSGQDASAYSASVFQPERHLDDDDTMLVQEIFWDLIVERVITIGSDASNPEFPWFRLHSEAVNNLRQQTS